MSSLTPARVSDRAGVSRRAFHALFESCEACLLAAIQGAVARIADVVMPAFLSREGWQARTRAALAALLSHLDRDPAAARLCVVDSLAAGPAILEYRMLVLAPVIRAVDEGRGMGSLEPSPPSLTAEGVVGAALHLIHARLVERSPEPLSNLLNPLMGMIVLPYLGEGAAEYELQMPAAIAAIDGGRSLPIERARTGLTKRGTAMAHVEASEGLKMRLTYRTLRVLRAIEASPGSSNREVGDLAEIVDPGQISKLLARLGDLELIHNAATSGTRGSRNVWRLTDKGRRLLGAIDR